ncbi:MAG: glyoxylate/hydroxypyruvate reductase A, partial [Rubrivivax sp.]
MNILLCGDFDVVEHRQWLAALQSALPEVDWLDREQAVAQAESIEVAVVANPPPGSLRGLPHLRLIQSLWAGVEGLLADATVPTDVPLARMVDPAMNDAMAQTALWAVLSLHRGFFANAVAQRAGVWHQQLQQPAEQVSVAVLGLGQMGQAAARRLGQQGYRVIGWHLDGRAPALDGVTLHRGAAALAPLLSASHIVVNLLPLTDTTRGLLDARFFAALPPGASIVNLGRGAHVVDDDLLAALDSGHLQHAVLDVFHQEPLPAQHRFWQHPRVTMLPHVAAQTDPSSAVMVVATNVRALLKGWPL